MARIRTIKPETWVDEKFTELTFPARLLFIGLWNFCDREGRMVYSPKRIKAQIFPCDPLEIVPLFQELQTQGLVTIYQASNARILSIPNFSKHQIVNAREPASLLPATGVAAIICDDVMVQDSTEQVPSIDQSVQKSEEGKGREGNRKGKEQNPAGKPADERFKPFVESLSNYWKFKNPTIDMTFGAAEGKQLKNLLADNPGLTVDQFTNCLRHRARSDVVHSEPPRMWLSAAVKYANGPLDRFNKPMETGNGNRQDKPISSADRRAYSIAETTARALVRVTGGVPSDDAPDVGIRADNLAQGPFILPPR